MRSIRCILFLTISAIVSGGVLHAQGYEPLLRPEASWDVALMESSTICGWVSGVTVSIIGDTLIGDHQYAQIGRQMIIDVDGPPFCPPGFAYGVSITAESYFLREDTLERKVYHYDPATSTELLLYDFTRQVGDTITDYFFEEETGPTVVISIDSVQLTDGTYRRRWNLSTEIWDQVLHDHIEGVGSTFGLLHDAPQYVGDGEHLWCYKWDEVNVLWSVHYCAQPTSLGIAEAGAGVVHEHLVISYIHGILSISSEQTVEGLYIWTADGRMVFQASSVRGGIVQLPQLSAGVYLYLLNSAEKQWRGRLYLE